MPRRTAAFLIALSMVVALPLPAHDLTLSTAQLSIHRATLNVLLTLTAKDAARLAAMDSGVERAALDLDLSAVQPRLKEIASRDFQLMIGGRAVEPRQVECQAVQGNAEIRMTFDAPGTNALTVRSMLLRSLAPGHRQLLTARSGDGPPSFERLLDARTPEVQVPFPGRAEAPLRLASSEPSMVSGWAGFFVVGVRHIWTGYDHLLFLFGLLIVTRHWGASVRIITCFTLAHSITLAAATFQLVNISSRLVEPAIAASIVYVGLENLWRRGEPRARWILTFLFGLVHGFGFASALREMGVGSAGHGIAAPLFSFNLGVEFGQVAVAALVLPLVWQFSRQPQFLARWVPACSLAVTLAGAFWFAQRLLNSAP